MNRVYSFSAFCFIYSLFTVGFKELDPCGTSPPNLFDTENNNGAAFVRSSHEGFTLTREAKTEVGKTVQTSNEAGSDQSSVSQLINPELVKTVHIRTHTNLL